MSNSCDCRLFSHTSFAMHTDHHHHHHHHAYESPKQYYSTQISHSFNNDNIVLPYTKITTATSLKKKKIHETLVIGQVYRRGFFVPSILHKMHPLNQANYKLTPLWRHGLFVPGVHLRFTGVSTTSSISPSSTTSAVAQPPPFIVTRVAIKVDLRPTNRVLTPSRIPMHTKRVLFKSTNGVTYNDGGQAILHDGGRANFSCTIT